MESYIMVNDYPSWQIIENGDIEIKLASGSIPSDDDTKKIEKNNKAKSLLLTTIAPFEFYLISSCKTAKQIWDKLCETYEGSDTIKDTKINALSQQYELFRFKFNEKIKDAFNCFNLITNERAALGKPIADSNLVQKIIMTLPRA